MKVVLQCSASPSTGAGHAVRCLALAEALRDAGHDAVHAGRLELGWVRDAWAREGVPTVDGTRGCEGDAGEAAARVSTERADWVVLDDYGVDGAWLDAFRRACGARVLVLDDTGERPLAADALLNQNLEARAVPHQRAETLLLGTHFALLRRGVRRLAARIPSPRAERVLVLAGGSDAGGVAPGMVRAALDAGAPSVVVPIASAHRDAVAAMDPARVAAVDPTPDVGALLERSDVALAAAGSSAWELAAAGIPMALTVAAPNQQAVARGLFAMGAALALPPATAWDGEKARAAAHRLLSDVGLRLRMANTARALVDGNGAARVVEAMEKGARRGA